MEEVYQVITKLLDGKTTLLSFPSPSIPVISIKTRIHQVTKIPIHEQILTSNGKLLSDKTLVPYHGPTVHLHLRLRGGKGGFGSLLRGAATKAGQKKTNNFDACRDMSGRRLRHVNAEKKMEDWRNEAEERKMEKIAEEFIKKKAKEMKKDGGGAGGKVEKYVDKYRKDSAMCMEEVDKTVRESFGVFVKSKRKGFAEEGNGSEAKKFKIWMGKRKIDESDSDDTDEDDSEDEIGDKNEKSVVINTDSNSESNKDEEGSSGSVTGGKLDREFSAGGSTESSSEEEKETLVNGRSESPQIPGPALNGEEDDPSGLLLKINEESVVQNKDVNKESGDVEEMVSKPTSISSSDGGINGNSVVEETMPVSTNVAEAEKPLNFDEFTSAAEMEVLGMERLKSELQARGLKCGGTLQERAARLFLLKTTPVEKLPKKLLAKK